MADFNPDEYLASKQAANEEKEFNPDAYLAEKAPEMPKEMGWPEYIGRGVTGALPVLGLTAGGAAGAELGPGAIGTAGLGYAAGNELQGLANHYLFGDALPSTNPLDQAKRLGSGVKEGAEAELGGKVLTGLAAPVAKYLSGKLSNLAESAAVKHLRPTAKVAQTLGPERLKEVGREALDTGAIRAMSKADQTAARLEEARDTAGKEIGSIIDESGATVDPLLVHQRLQNEVVAPLKSVSETVPLAKTMERKGKTFLEVNAPGHATGAPVAPIPVSQSEAEKRAVQNNVNWLQDTNAAKDAKVQWQRILKEEGEKAVNDPRFIPAKQKFGKLDAAADMANRTAGLSSGGTGLMGHMIDTGVGLEAVSKLAHGDLTGVPVAIGRGLTKGRVASTAAVSADQMSHLLKTAPQRLGKYAPIIANSLQRGAQSYAATHYLLSQTDPNYRDTVGGLEENTDLHK
jgi:hypothetical protein